MKKCQNSHKPERREKIAREFFYENLQIEPRLIEKILSSRDSGPIEFTSEKAEEEKLTRVKFAYSKRIFSCYFQKILKEKIKVAQICSNEF